MDAVQRRLDLEKRWRATKAAMARACAALLPPPSSTERERFEDSISRYHHYISHNELELAFEELCAAAELANSRGGVWRNLERAAQFMQLYNRLAYLRERFRAAPVSE